MPLASKMNCAGADSPNESTPTTLSAYLYQTAVTPASTAVVIDLSGRTDA